MKAGLRVLAAIVAGGALLTPSNYADAAPRRWATPVTPTRLTRGYDPPAHQWLAGHRGIDLRSSPGQTVRAAGSGTVSFAGILAGRYVVSIDHGELRTSYEPVKPTVSKGERVGAGEVIGEIAPGSGHCGTGSCLHFGVRRGKTYLDPLLLLAGWQAVLRPPQPRGLQP
ncbi:MAG: M23 family metallopeptidase [Candidatus Nanopelagicales bacterium]